MRYLDPKADMTFHRVFGKHPDLVTSLLNALLPFSKDEELITEVEYLPSEMVPENPLRKFSIVDVRCHNKLSCQFLVEIQMIWSPEFTQRILFNASEVYVCQRDIDKKYNLLQPVYSLNLSTEVIQPELSEEYYHYYRTVYAEHSHQLIEGLHLIFVELPKFTPHTFSEKKMRTLWLRYLTEINEQRLQLPTDLLANPEIKKAVTAIEESVFTPAQLLGYEKFWDIISVERTLFSSGERKGREEGRKEGREEGHIQATLKMARQMKAKGLTIEDIAGYTQLTPEEIEKL